MPPPCCTRKTTPRTRFAAAGDGVPKGTVTRLKLEPGKFYPGTPHNYAIYVPAQYNAAKPAPFMIFLDGSGVARQQRARARGLRQSDREAANCRR